MRDSAPYRLTERRQAILRQASAALRGRMVTLWRMASGFAVAEVASQPTVPRDLIDFDVAAALRMWGRAVAEGSLWVVCRLDPGRWHVAPVRSDVPAARVEAAHDPEDRKSTRLHSSHEWISCDVCTGPPPYSCPPRSRWRGGESAAGAAGCDRVRGGRGLPGVGPRRGRGDALGRVPPRPGPLARGPGPQGRARGPGRGGTRPR